MLDVRRLRSDFDAVATALARRGEDLTPSLEKARELDLRERGLAADRDEIRSRINQLSKEVGGLRRDGRADEAENLQVESRDLGEQEQKLDLEATAVADELRDLLLRIPNLPAADAPDGRDEHDNVVVRVEDFDPDSYQPHQRVPHWDIGRELGVLDLERGAKVSGSMFAMLRGAGATLSRALCQFALDRNSDAYEEIRPPSLVLTRTLTATGQLPKFADDAYHVERDDLWAIPTAEVPLTSIGMDEVLAEADLPQRLMAYSPCFRREAGSAGRDTRGLLRVHEFDKVELLAYATPAQAPAMLDEILGTGRRPDPRARTRPPRARHLHGRHGPVPPPLVRHRGLRPRGRPVARGVVGVVVQRLSGAPGQHPLPPDRRQGGRTGPHPQRIGPGGAPCVGGARRDPSPAGRVGRPARRVAPLPAGHDPAGPARGGLTVVPEETAEPAAPTPLMRRVPWGAVSGTVVLAYIVVWALGLSRIAQRATFNRWGAALGSLGARVVVCAVVLATLFHSLDGLRRLMAEAVPRTKEHDLRWRAWVLFVTWAVALPCFAVILWPWVAETTR